MTTLVYFIRPVGQLGPIKIGSSNSPVDRLATLAAWAPMPLEIIAAVPGTMKDEFWLHDCFADRHSHREWFNPDLKMLEAIEAVRASGSLDAIRDLKPVGNIRANRPKRLWTDDQRRRVSYNHRVERARKRISGDDFYYSAPDDINVIISKWCGWHGYKIRTIPTDAEIARLDAFIADPLANGAVRHERTASRRVSQ